MKDVFIITLTAFGSTHAHIPIFVRHLVEKRAYLTETAFMELQALCQFLPGPTSTQTIVAIGYKKGGTVLAFLTLLVWCLPATLVMTAFGVWMQYAADPHTASLLRFMQPVAIALVLYAVMILWGRFVVDGASWILAICAAALSYFFQYPFLFPLLLLAGGATTALRQKRSSHQKNIPVSIRWRPLFLWAILLLVAYAVYLLSDWQLAYIFQTFYLKGSMIFGGGQMLVPFMLTEFVHYKHYLGETDFLHGLAVVESIPGPVFALTAYIGSFLVDNHGAIGQLLGGLTAALGAFLPGVLFIFFAYPFWEVLKRYHFVKAAIKGVIATNVGLIMAASIVLLRTIEHLPISLLVMLGSVGLLFLRLPIPILVLCSVLCGLLF